MKPAREGSAPPSYHASAIAPTKATWAALMMLYVV
jgi:hypothetical protein